MHPRASLLMKCQMSRLSYTVSLVSGEIIYVFDAPSSVHKNIVMRIANYYEYLYLMIWYCRTCTTRIEEWESCEPTCTSEVEEDPVLTKITEREVSPTLIAELVVLKLPMAEGMDKPGELASPRRGGELATPVWEEELAPAWDDEVPTTEVEKDGGLLTSMC